VISGIPIRAARAPPAGLADGQWLKIGQPDLIGPAVRVDLLVGENLYRAALARQPLPSRRKMPLITDRTRECDLTAIDRILSASMRRC
jgi:hypothetical protein